MPKRNGFDVLRALKEDPATAGIPVIVLSTLGQESDVQQALEAGAVDYLVKSALPLRELARRVTDRLDGGSPA
jgi:CheY-like chemotaxis protein